MLRWFKLNLKMLQKMFLPTRIYFEQYHQWCLMFWIDSKLTFNKWSRNGDGCMHASPHSKVASWLPRLGLWVPGEDWGEHLAAIITSGDEEDIVDRGSSQSAPWWGKLSALHLPPLQLVATRIDSHLVGTALLLIWMSKQWKLIVGQSKQNKLTSVLESQPASMVKPPVTRSTWTFVLLHLSTSPRKLPPSPDSFP